MQAQRGKLGFKHAREVAQAHRFSVEQIRYFTNAAQGIRCCSSHGIPANKGASVAWALSSVIAASESW